MKKTLIIGSLLIILTFGITYAWWTWTNTNNTNVTFTIEGATITYNGGNNISNIKLIPVSTKEVGVTNNTAVYKEITATANKTMYLTLNLTLTTFPSNLAHQSLLWEIYKGTTKIGNGNFSGKSQGDTITLFTNNEINATSSLYKLYIWIDGNQDNPSTMMNQSYVFTLNATATDEAPPLDTSGANSPDLVQGLIPVKYDDTNSTWVKADSTNTDSNNQWYDYDNKMWANAVLVRETAYSENISETNKTVSINNTGASIKKYTSSNQDVNSSSSINTFTFTTGSTTGTLSFDYSVSSEEDYDKLTIKLNSTTLVNAISGTQSSSYTGDLAANTTYTLTATYTKDSINASGDDQATISNIQVSNISGSISVGSSGSYPWTESTITQYTVNTYTSYQLQEDGNYTLTGKNNVQASDTVGKYICSDTTSTTCTTIYKITGYSSNTINKVDSYNTTLFSARSTYNSASAGTEIKENAILAYYVWIPRYKYKVFNITKTIDTDSYNAKTTGIDIVFENGTASTGTISCTNYSFAAPNSSTPNETCTGSNGDYYTHPAFTFGTTQLKGIWVGKFEISSETPDAQTNGDYYGGGNVTNLTVRIKPNITSWRYNRVSNFYKVIYDMQKSSNIYGLSTDRTNTDSHMMKNTEWGAVAYLTNSKYGRCSNNTCTEVTINNSSDYITGNAGSTISASETPGTTNAYNTTAGQLASTTGNIYGIYDTSGGAYEYVMGNMSSGAGSYTYYASSGGSNYTYSGNEKYIDTYAYGVSGGNQTAYNRSRLGDATGETVGWYSDYNTFVYSTYSWFNRGSSFFDTTGAGPFNFLSTDGLYVHNFSARASLLYTSN